MEWDAVSCCERMRPGCISVVFSKTAGNIAKSLVELAGQQASPAEILAPAREFERLVQIRNKLLHGKPIAGKNGAGSLHSGPTGWTITSINDVADDFVVCSIAD